MKRIVMVVTSDLVYDNRVRREAASLAAAGYAVTIVCAARPTGQTELSIPGVSIMRLALPAATGVIDQISSNLPYLLTFGSRSQWMLFRALRTIPADIYHAHDFDTLIAVGRAAASQRVPFVYDSHELFVDTLNEFSSGSRLHRVYMKTLAVYVAWQERRWARRAAAVITVNQPIADELARRYGLSRPTVVMNCVNIQTVDRPVDLRAKLRLPSTAKLVLYQGMLGPGRGLRQLVDSVPLLPPEYHLLFLGYGALGSSLLAQAKSQGVSDRVHLLPPVSGQELLAFTAGADVGVLTIEDFNLSKRYATPNKLFEYMMVGLPVAASDLPVLRQIVTDAGCGRFFPSLQPADIAQTITAVMTASDYEQWRQRSLQAAKTKYNWSVESRKLVGVYQSFASYVRH